MTMKDTGLVTTSTNQVLTRWNGGPVTTAFTKSVEHNYMVGADIPHFHKKLRKGILLPHTAFFQQKAKYAWVSGSYSSAINPPSTAWSNIANFGASYQSSLCVLPVYPSMTETLFEMAKHYPGPDKSVLPYQLQRAAARVYSQGFDSLTFVSELPKLRRSLQNIAVNMKKLYGKFNVKYLSLKEKDSLLKETFQEWLRYRYEWRTLLYDVRDLHGAITEFDEKRKIFSERQGTTQSGVSHKTKTYTGTDHTYVCDLYISYEHSLRGAVSGKITPPRMQINPVVTAWELLTWSFILDWAIDVGTAIEALSFAAFSQEYTASHGVSTKLTITQNLVGTAVPGKTGSASMSHSGNVEIQTRHPASVTYVPQLTRKMTDPLWLLDLQALARLARNPRRH